MTTTLPVEILQRVVAGHLAMRGEVAATKLLANRGNQFENLLVVHEDKPTRETYRLQHGNQPMIFRSLLITLPVSTHKRLVVAKGDSTEMFMQYTVYVNEYEPGWGCWIAKYMRIGCGDCYISDEDARQVWYDDAFSRQESLHFFPRIFF